MGAMIESAIDKGVRRADAPRRGAGQKRDGGDHLIDQKERTIERHVPQASADSAAIARDLRKVSSALKMITDMERIGDQPPTSAKS